MKLVDDTGPYVVSTGEVNTVNTDRLSRSPPTCVGPEGRGPVYETEPRDRESPL